MFLFGPKMATIECRRFSKLIGFRRLCEDAFPEEMSLLPGTEVGLTTESALNH